MKSKTTQQFRDLLATLPEQVQQQAREAYRLFQRDPYHPSLRFKHLNTRLPLASARVGLHYRALAIRRPDHLLWFWIGTHADYDKILARF